MICSVVIFCPIDFCLNLGICRYLLHFLCYLILWLVNINECICSLFFFSWDKNILELLCLSVIFGMDLLLFLCLLYHQLLIQVIPNYNLSCLLSSPGVLSLASFVFHDVDFLWCFIILMVQDIFLSVNYHTSVFSSGFVSVKKYKCHNFKI